MNTVRYAKDQRALDGPDGRHRTDLRHDRVAAKHGLVLGAVSPGHQLSEYEVRHAHHHQRR